MAPRTKFSEQFPYTEEQMAPRPYTEEQMAPRTKFSEQFPYTEEQFPYTTYDQ